jgi:hypothetical protein
VGGHFAAIVPRSRLVKLWPSALIDINQKHVVYLLVRVSIVWDVLFRLVPMLLSCDVCYWFKHDIPQGLKLSMLMLLVN